MVKNATYTGIIPSSGARATPWGTTKSWIVWGTPNCGKGQPPQVRAHRPRRRARQDPQCPRRGCQMSQTHRDSPRSQNLGAEAVRRDHEPGPRPFASDQAEHRAVPPHRFSADAICEFVHPSKCRRGEHRRARAGRLWQTGGVASTNNLSPDALKSVVDMARAIAQHQRENPDFKSLPRSAARSRRSKPGSSGRPTKRPSSAHMR